MIKNKVLNKKKLPLYSLLISVIIVILATISAPAQAKTAYISDDIRVAMRSGASNGHRIIKFLNSGVAFKVLDTSDDEKYVEIELSDGKTGWVATENIMDVPSARDRLLVANNKLSKVRQKNKDLENTIAKLIAETKELKSEKKVLQDERADLSNSLDDLKITAANPLALSKKNRQLKKELSIAEATVTKLDRDNKQLRSNAAQDWFLIGGGVSMGSLIIGLILTRINWTRKRESWGDSY